MYIKLMSTLLSFISVTKDDSLGNKDLALYRVIIGIDWSKGFTFLHIFLIGGNLVSGSLLGLYP